MFWQKATGEKIPIHRLEDLHLANIWFHVRLYKCESVIPIIRNEIIRRGMPESFLVGAPYPYFDMIDKVWKKWSIEECRDVEL